MTGRRAELVGLVVATVWLVAAVAVDVVVSGSTLLVASLFAAAPLIACSLLAVPATVGFAAAAVVLAVGSGWWNGVWGTDQQVVRVIDVLFVSVAAVSVAAVRGRREREFARVVAIAEVAQRALLPTLPVRVQQVAVSARYVSAAEDTLVGGDFYDCYVTDSGTQFLVGDVRGKGVGAVELSARVIRAFRQYAGSSSLSRVASAMSVSLVPFLHEEDFVTALLVDVSDADQMKVVSCGHPPPVLVAAGGTVSFLDPPAGLPLGWGRNYRALKEPWAPGDRLLMYTDGLSEARDASGQFLSPLALAPALSAKTVDQALAAVLEATRQHVPKGRLTDDLAAVLLENTPISESDGPVWFTQESPGPLRTGLSSGGSTSLLE